MFARSSVGSNARTRTKQLFDFVFLLLARDSSSKLGSPLARASVRHYKLLLLFRQILVAVYDSYRKIPAFIFYCVSHNYQLSISFADFALARDSKRVCYPLAYSQSCQLSINPAWLCVRFVRRFYPLKFVYQFFVCDNNLILFVKVIFLFKNLTSLTFLRHGIVSELSLLMPQSKS